MGTILRWIGALLVGVVATATLTTLSSAPARAAYPGEDGRIAFVRGGQIYTMGPGGASVTRLTFNGKNVRPEWSPDGRLISYIHETADGRRDVWVMRPAGRGKRAITTTGDVTSAGASWAPDGTTLAYAAAGVLQLVGVAPGSTPTTPSGYETNSFCDSEPAAIAVDTYLAWSPDGARIALFNRSDCRYDWAIWWFYPATGELRQHMGGGADCCGYDHWTDLFFGPTGEFGYVNEATPDYETYEPPVIVYPGFASRPHDVGAAPSPSGRYMAFSNNATGVSYVMRADVDGAHRRPLARGYQPDWQPRL